MVVKLKDIVGTTLESDIIRYYSDHSSNSVCTNFNITSLTLDKLLDKNNLKKHSKVENMQLTCIEKYGVVNPSQSSAAKNTYANRTDEDRKRSNTKREQTCLEKYGVTHVRQDTDINNKCKQTTIDRYGYENFSCNKKLLRERTIKTCLEKYGAKYYTQTEEYRKRSKETFIEHYGVDNIFKSEEFKQQQHLDTLENYNNKEFAELFSDRAACIQFLQEHKLSAIQLASYFNQSLPTIESWLCRNNLKDYVTYTKSSYEIELKNLFPEFKHNDRTSLGNGQELDLYSPEHHIGIEFNGNYWHSSIAGVDKFYHQQKSLLAESKGIRLIHIYEYEWNDPIKKNILISMINLTLGKIQNRIFARNCEIREISNSEAKPFNENNHLQGHRNAQITYGLFYKGDLVQLMSFSKSKYNRNLKGDNDWEIIRGCPGSNNLVVGGVSKLFKYFIVTHKPDMIFSYCDFNKFDGRGYTAIGMQFEGYTSPDKTWIINGKGVPRSPQKYKEYTEKGYPVIWGAGSKRFVWRNQNA